MQAGSGYDKITKLYRELSFSLGKKNHLNNPV